MRPTDLANTIKARVAAGMKRSVLIEGSPGLGKTQIVRQIAHDLDIGFRTVHAPLMQPEDYGMPVTSAARDDVKFVVPSEKFPLEGSDCEEQGILLLDELPQADNAGQKILANLVQEREIHGHRIKDGWTIIATGNRAADRAGANRILSHLRNRMTTLEFEPNLDDWCNWYLDQPECKVEGLAFLRFRPNLLSDFNPQKEINPTPRSWVEGVFASLGVVPPEAEFECFKGDVGEGPASEFVAFLQIFRKLPDPDLVLMNPEKHELPTETAVLYALTGAIAARADEKNFDAVLKFARRLSPEYTVLCVRDSIRHCKGVTQTKAFQQWAVKEGAKILY